MRKILIILLLFCGKSYGQTIDTLLAYKGILKYYTNYTLPNTTLQYFTGYGTWGSLTDTVRSLISYTGENYLAYNSSTGVITGSAVNLAGTNVTGTLVPTKGGTGLATYTTGDILYASATNVLSKLAIGTTGQHLQIVGGLPVWRDTTASGSAITPSALTKVDDANVTLTLGGTPTTALLQATSLTLGWTGVLSIARGGTGLGSLGTANQELRVNAGATALEYYTPSAGGAGWELTGNASTSAGTNFVGTTDAAEVMIKTNSIIRASFGARSYIDSIPIWRGAGTQVNRLGNIGIGDSSLFSTTADGLGNTGLGYFSLARTTTGTNNTALGYQSLWKNSTGVSNTAVGSSALTSNTTGQQSTAVGHSALLSNTTQSGLTAVGHEALRASVSGQFNSAFGWKALAVNTGGSYNTAIGYNAMGASVNGDQSTAVGYGTLQANSSGTANVAMGVLTLGSNTSGANNTALGYNAMGANSSGGANIALGYYAGSNNGTTSNQVWINSLNRSNEIAGQNNSIFYGQQSLTVNSQISTLNGKVAINSIAPTAYLMLSRGTPAVSSAPLKFPAPVSLTTTAASGTGSTATLTFATTTNFAFVLGSTVVIEGVTPAGYNATAIITAITPTTISYANATTGAQTVAGTITQGQPTIIPENGAVERDSINLLWSSGTGINLTRYTLAKTLTATATLDFDLTAVNSQDLTITVTGAASGDAVSLALDPASVAADITFFGWVSAVNTVTVRCSRVGGGGAADPASGTFRASVIRY